MAGKDGSSDEARERLEASFQSRRETFETGLEELRQLLAKCESPVEELLLVSMIAYFFLDASGDGARGEVVDPRFDGYRLFVQPQAEVATPQGRFRCDFLLQIEKWRDGTKTVVLSLCVEVDGHDFHERTKQQASHDRRRDRAMCAAGIQVIRFTGSDVFRDADDCAGQIEQILLQHVERTR